MSNNDMSKQPFYAVLWTSDILSGSKLSTFTKAYRGYVMGVGGWGGRGGGRGWRPPVGLVLKSTFDVNH